MIFRLESDATTFLKTIKSVNLHYVFNRTQSLGNGLKLIFSSKIKLYLRNAEKIHYTLINSVSWTLNSQHAGCCSAGPL